MTDKPLGRLNQIAFIVPDLEPAIRWWTDIMGVGPFFVFPAFDMVRGDYRGREHKADFGAAVTFSGDLMVELIEPRGPSIFQEFMDKGVKSVHHLCAFSDSMKRATEWINDRGGKRIQSAEFTDGSQVAYFAMNEDESVILEVAALKPEVLGLFNAVQSAAANWDGVTRIFDPMNS